MMVVDSDLSITNGGNVIYYSKEFADQYKRRKRHSIVQPQLMNEPELFIPVGDVIESFLEAEAFTWKKIVNSPFSHHQDLSGSFTSSSNGSMSPLGLSCTAVDTSDITDVKELTGEAFLRHGKFQQEIHQYFVKLDPRRCCVNCKKVDKTRVSSGPLKLVKEETRSRQDSFGRGNRGAGSARNRGRTVKQLNPQDEKIYKHLLKCAYHPPLDEPTPSPQWNRGSSRNDATKRYHQFAIDSTVSIEHNMLITKLQRAFHVNTYLHDKLKNELIKVLPNRDFSVALAGNLMDQLSRLECNGCTFYQPSFFANGDFYEEWRREEMNFVSRLLQKWCSDEVGIHACILQSFDSHEAFKIIVQKFLSLDLNDKSENANGNMLNRTLNSVLTTASRKLLNEFCMWYGVGGIFRQLAILNAMVENIIFSDWYLQCLLLGLEETMEFIFDRQNFLVRQEREFAESILNRLTYQVEYGFIKLFSLYEQYLSGDGIQMLLILLQQVRHAKLLFTLSEENEDSSFEDLAKHYIELASAEHYNLSKGFAEYNSLLDERNKASLSPEVLRLALQDIKKCVVIAEDLSCKCPLLMKMCPNLVEVVARKLYAEFMDDIKEVCFLNTDTIEFSVVNYEMMGLAFRLDRLDKDWMRFIPPENQKWRRYFKIVLAVTLRAISMHLLKEITNFVLKDDLEIIHLDSFLSHLSKSKESSPVVFSRDFRHTIKHSDNSAFTSVTSLNCSPISGFSNVKSLRSLLRKGSTIGVECRLNGSQSDRTSSSGSQSDRMSTSSSPSISTLSNEEEECESASNKNPDGLGELANCIAMTKETSNGLQYKLDKYVMPNKFATSKNASNGKRSGAAITVGCILGQIIDDVFDRIRINRTLGGRNIEPNIVGDSQNFKSRQLSKEIMAGEILEDVLDAVMENASDTSKRTDQSALQHNRFTDSPIPLQCRNFVSSTQTVDKRRYSDPTRKNSLAKLPKVTACRYVTEGPSIDNFHGARVGNISDITVFKPDTIFKAIPITNGFEKTPYVASDVPRLKSNSMESFQSLDNFRTEDLPNNGHILTTSSLTDLLISCSRLISFAHVVCSIVLPLDSSMIDDTLSDYSREKHELRVDILQKVMLSVGELLEAYATNIFTLDSCGSSMFQVGKEQPPNCSSPSDCMHDGRLRKRDDINVVVKDGFEVLSGCRHIKLQEAKRNSGEVGESCPLLKRLLERSLGNWELVTKEMCFRINNIYSLLRAMPVLQKRTTDGMNIDLQKLLAEMASEQPSELTCHQDCPCSYPGDKFCFYFHECHEYLRKILHLQVKFLACRVMDIFSKIFDELRTLPQRNASICEHMKSSLEYLRGQMKFFRHALYEQCVHLVVIAVSQLIVEKFHDLLDELSCCTDNPCAEAMRLQELLLGAVKYLDADKSVEMQISDQLNVILFRFQLFVLPLDKVRSLYDTMEGRRKKISQSQNSQAYHMEELVYLIKHELDKGGKPSFTGAQLIDALIENDHLLNSLVSLLDMNENEDVKRKAHEVGRSFLKNNIVRCISVLQRCTKRRETLERVCVPNSMPVNIPKAFLPDMNLTIDCTPDDNSPSHSFVDRYDVCSNDFSTSFVLNGSVISHVSEDIFEEPQPCVGSDTFFARDDVLYCFLLDDETPESLLLTGELYSMVREEGDWLEMAVKNDIITRFSYVFRERRTAEIVDFFVTYGVQPLHVRRFSCLW